MCLFPVSVPNPYLAGRYVRTGRSIARSSDRLRSASSTIEVPCGKCSECMSRRYTDLLQRCYVESLTSYVFMVSLTYSPRAVPTLDLSVLTSLPYSAPGHRPRCVSSIQPIYYANYDHIKNLFKRLRNDPLFSGREFRYFVVSEYGSERQRPHFHILFFVARLDTDSLTYGSTLESQLKPLFKLYFSENVGTRKCPVYEPYFDDVTRIIDGVEHSTFDLHLVRPRDAVGRYVDGDSSSSAATVSSYVMSYVNKSNRFESYILSNYRRFHRLLDPDVADRFRSILKCRCAYSHQFGFGFDTRTGKRIVPPCRYSIPESFTLSSASRFELYRSLPDSYEEFFSLFPDLAEAYESWWSELCTDNCWSVRFDSYAAFHYFEGAATDVYFVIALKYHPERPLMFVEYHRWSHSFSLSGIPCLSSSADDSAYSSSVSYKFLTKAVRNSVARGSFFSVEIVDEKGPRTVPMCSYYKSYFVTDSDVLSLYDRLGCADLDDYLRLMIYYQRPYSDRLARSIQFAQDSSYLEKKRFHFHRNLQNCANHIAYSKNLYIFAPDTSSLHDPSAPASDVPCPDLAAIDRRRIARYGRIRRFINKMFPLYEKGT